MLRMAADVENSMSRLQCMLERLREDYYAAGHGGAFEDHADRLKAEGKWPFPC